MFYEASLITIGILLSILTVIISIFWMIRSRSLMESAELDGRMSDRDELKRLYVISIILLSVSALALLLFIVIPLSAKSMAYSRSMVAPVQMSAPMQMAPMSSRNCNYPMLPVQRY
jgi:hypothetical protein